MDEQEIKEKIKKAIKFEAESDTLEFKKSKNNLPKIYDTISSFSNTRGGLIVLGIDEKDNFKIIGVENINEIQNKISEICTQKMYPLIRPIITQIDYENKKLLVVEILELKQIEKPCYYIPNGIEKGSYIRVGDNDQKMTKYEIYALQSYKSGVNEDLKSVKRAEVKDFDEEKLNKYLSVIKKEKPKFSKKDKNGILKISNIIKEEKDGKIYPTLAGIMIFGVYPQQFYPQLFIACSVVPGVEIGELGSQNQRFDDNARIEGNIEEMLNDTLSFLKKNMKTKIIIDENGKRKNIPEYPLIALREAIVNALVHRDYSIYTEKSYIKVFKYEDRIEIENPGGLYGINRIEQLGTDTMLEVRNPFIVQILENEKNILENRHSGIPTMKAEMTKMNLKEPVFINEKGTFKVIFYNEKQKSEQVEKNSIQVIEKNSINIRKNNVLEQSEQVEKNSAQVKKISVENTSKNNTLKQNKKIQKYSAQVLEYCSEPKTRKEITAYLGLKSINYVAKKIINPLIENKKLKYTNSNRRAKNQKYVTIKAREEGK